MALDRQAILDAVYQGAGQPAANLIPPTLWSYNKAVQPYPHDPEAAKKLLAEAGFPDGFETDLWAMPVQRPYNPDARRVAELMQADLLKVGVRARIVQLRVGRVPQAGAEQRGADGAARLDGGQRRPGQLLHPARQLRRRAGGGAARPPNGATRRSTR